MATHKATGERACMDRCEVCQRVLTRRPDPARRRCGDHLNQLELVPTNPPTPTKSSTTTRTSEKPRRRGREERTR